MRFYNILFKIDNFAVIYYGARFHLGMSFGKDKSRKSPWKVG